jgi:hypothetical protein
MLTTISQLVHDNVHAEIRDVLQENPANLAEKDGVKILFRSTKNKQQESAGIHARNSGSTWFSGAAPYNGS